MTKNKDRRNFIIKTITGFTSLFISTRKGIAGIFNDPNKKTINKTGDTTMNEKNILKIKPLGFQWETSDPFLFCVHHEDFYPKGNDQFGPDASLEGRNIGQDFEVKDGWRMYHGSKVPGFPVHPHRGFETVTVVRTGFIDHSDSMGAAGRYSAGDVQWMTAGKGIQHSEMFPLLRKDSTNPLELFQIWLNLPKANKFVEPIYKMFWSDSIPYHNEKDENGKSVEINIIAGKIGAKEAVPPPPDSWAADSNNDVAIWTIRMESGSNWKLPASRPGINRTLYFFRGTKLKVDGYDIPSYHSLEIKPDSEILLQSGADDIYLLLLQGKPINEPVVQYGPFVMNTKEEIQQAYSDYRDTEFGGWPWPSPEPVHPKDSGRFAKFIDGKIENPD